MAVDTLMVKFDMMTKEQCDALVALAAKAEELLALVDASEDLLALAENKAEILASLEGGDT